MNASLLDDLLRGVAIETPPRGLAGKLKESEKEKRSLIVKLGFDPTAPDLHLGHAVVLRKMRQFQDAGHKLVIIIGDFTARIGDPTGRNKTRPPLSPETIKQNALTYLDQLSKVLDMSREKLKVCFNDDWLGAMTFRDVIGLLAKATVAQLLQREDFSKRYNEGTAIGMHEMLYPLMQGYDSIEINADIEMGGTDQLFNCLVGRALQEAEGKSGQIVLSMPLLVGLDGKEKMSKSYNNYIGLTEPPHDMYGKAMSIPDTLLPMYLELATTLTAQEIARLKEDLAADKVNPMDVKKLVAANIVTQYHDEKSAEEAAQYFYNQFQNKADEEKSYEPFAAAQIYEGAQELALLDLCARLCPQESKSQLRRLIAASAVSVDGEKLTDPAALIKPPVDKEIHFRIGKRGFYAIIS
ncbi:MAG: tyrosine--tRNA ligase [Alphaproteobacteria bacterium]|nr:tyrosine--tRNA ligase [Alphaproteobacteria bacterium]